MAGLEYNAGCWAARFVLHRFVTNTQERTNALFFQLELTGLSRMGTSPLELLRQGIGGYTARSLRPVRRRSDYYPGCERALSAARFNPRIRDSMRSRSTRLFMCLLCCAPASPAAAQEARSAVN